MLRLRQLLFELGRMAFIAFAIAAFLIDEPQIYRLIQVAICIVTALLAMSLGKKFSYAFFAAMAMLNMLVVIT